MEIRIAVAKVDRYGSSESGDTVEVIERPNGGLSVVFADGQTNHKSNKSISTWSVIESLITSVMVSGMARQSGLFPAQFLPNIREISNQT